MADQLMSGLARFTNEVLPSKAELLAGLVHGQSPHTLFIACADSRVDPSLIVQANPGDLFVVRNAGNIVPALDSDGSSEDGTAASIEYAVAVLGVQHIVVCGHSGCGAMAGLMEPESLYPAVRDALDQGSVTLHGWVYDIATGVVRQHDGDEFVAFVP